MSESVIVTHSVSAVSGCQHSKDASAVVSERIGTRTRVGYRPRSTHCGHGAGAYRNCGGIASRLLPQATGSTRGSRVRASLTGPTSGGRRRRTSSPRLAQATNRFCRNISSPRFADEPLSAIAYPRVPAFLSDLAAEGMGSGTLRNVRDVFRLVMALAVRSGAIKQNPVLGARLGRPASRR
jgi:hypothetical protein